MLFKHLEMARIRMFIKNVIAKYSGSNILYSSGTVVKPTLSYNSGTRELTVGQGMYRTFLTTDYSGILKEYTVPQTTLTLLDNTKYYICATYNNGNPIVYAETDIGIANDSAVLVIYTLFTEGNELDVLDWGFEGISLANRINERLIDTDRYGIVGGFGLSASSRVITIAGGEFYLGSNKIAYNSITSNVNECELIWRNGSGGFNEQDVTLYPNTQYDNGSGTLATLTDTHYGIVWIWKSAGNPIEMYAMLGDQSYANLELAKGGKIPPDIPEKVSLGAFLVGRIIFQKGSSTAIVESAFDTVFNANAPTLHNSLLNLQGGSVGEYYHLSNVQITTINKINSILTGFSTATLYSGANDIHTKTTVSGYTKLNITLTPSSILGSFTLDTINGRLVYTGTTTKRFYFNSTATISNGNTNNTVISFKLYKNGITPQDQTLSIAKLDSATDYENINASIDVILNQNDYIEVFASVDKNITFTTSGVQLSFDENIGYTFNN